MVMAVVGRRVTVMPLTTKGEREPDTALALPDPVRTAMGLSGEKSSNLMPGELNAFDWVGHDLRPIGQTDSFYYGRCPPTFFAKALDACTGTTSTSRD